MRNLDGWKETRLYRKSLRAKRCTKRNVSNFEARVQTAEYNMSRYSTAIIRNSSIRTSRSRRRSDGGRNTRTACSAGPSGCRPGGGESWCAGSWDRIGPRRRGRSGLLKARDSFFFNRRSFSRRIASSAIISFDLSTDEYRYRSDRLRSVDGSIYRDLMLRVASG